MPPFLAPLVPSQPLADGAAASDRSAGHSIVFAVFGQLREGAAMEYLGRAKGRTAAEAMQLAQTQYGSHSSGPELWLAPAPAIGVTPWVADTESVYDTLDNQLPVPAGPEPDESLLEAAAYARGEEDYAIFHQDEPQAPHVHAGMVRAATPNEALQQAKAIFGAIHRPVNVWVVRWADILTPGARGSTASG